MQLHTPRRIASLVLVLLTGFAVPQATQAQTVTAGATPGQFDVTPTGAAQYTVPVAVPPGTAGMAPGLSLSYNSQGGNGLLGMGWSLSGLSAITRCPKTLMQDNTKSGINYDANDKYCLDGQRLVAISGTYGANGTEYRTERDGFSRIISYGSNGYGPTNFKVWTKSGQIMEFGTTADSAIELQGKVAIRVWAVNKIADTKGNYLTVTYTEDNPNGQYYPSRIDYTGNASATPVLPPYNSVRFVYAARPDIEQAYDGGSMIKLMVRLTDVQTWANVNGTDTMVKDYRLAYDTSVTTLRSRLISLTECDGAVTPTCLQPSSMIWANGSTALLSPNYNIPALPNFVAPGYYNRNGVAGFELLGDFNGDGKTDLLWQPGGADGRWLIAYGTDTGFTTPDVNNPVLPYMYNGYYNQHTTGDNYYHIADFNGDGKADYMFIPTNGDGRWLIAYGTATGLTQPDYNNPALPNMVGGYYNRNGNPIYEQVADFNGDGRADYMWIPGNGDGRRLIAYGTATGFTIPDYNNPALPNFVAPGYYNRNGVAGFELLGDFNGDGKTDLLWQPSGADGRWLIAYGTDTGFTTPDVNNPVLPYMYNGYYNQHTTGDNYYHIADFNGDGKADYMFIPTNGDGRWLIAYGTATGLTQPDYNNPALPNMVGGYYNRNGNPSYEKIGDFNGDGKADYMWIPSNGDGRWLIAYGTATGFTQPVYANQALANLFDGVYYNRADGNPLYTVLGDFNGDGKTDYLWIPSNGDGRRLIAYGGGKQLSDFANSITTGLGASTTISYKPLTDASVYSKDSGAVYPYVDLQVPQYVVSSVSSSDGIGGNYVSNYSYAGAKSHMTGGGYLGFRQTTNTDAQTGIVSTTTYRQDYPYQGLPLTAEKRTSGNVLLNSVSNTWSFATNPAWSAQYHVPQLTQSVENSYELNGSLISTVTTANTYDAYGNPTQITVSTPDGYSKTTTNTYTNDIVNWYLGRLTGATVTSTTP